MMMNDNSEGRLRRRRDDSSNSGGNDLCFSPPQRVKSNYRFNKLQSSASSGSSPQLPHLAGSSLLPSKDYYSRNDKFWLKIAAIILSVLLVIAVSVAATVLLKQQPNQGGAVDTEMSRLMADLEKKLESEEGMGQVVKDLQTRLQTALTEKEDLRKTVESLEKDKRNLEEEASKNNAPALRGNDEVRKQVEVLDNYRKGLQKGIQAMAKQRIVEKWGKGPHRVQVSLRFDPSTIQPDQPSNGTIVLEMAPIDDMPYTVYWFLEQVTRKLFDGCSFNRNLKHIVGTGPAANFLSPPNPMLERRFVDAGFDRVIFQEYSSDFPHAMYTVGYSGRPGGPGWYVNVRDNNDVHGPGGQDNMGIGLKGDADPCFAKVISGFDLVDRIHKSPSRADDNSYLQTNVAITEMKLL